MPDLKDPGRLARLADQALASDEIKNVLQRDSTLNEPTLRNAIRDRAPKIWDRVAEEIARIESLTAEHARVESDYGEKKPKEPPFLEGLAGSGAALLALGFWGVVIWLFIQGWRKVTDTLLSYGTHPLAPFVYAALIVAILLAIFLRRQHRRRVAEFEKSAEQAYPRDRLKKQLEATQATLDEKLLGAVNGELRAIIQRLTAPSYATTLGVTHAPGLAEVFDPMYEIATRSKTRLVGLLERMPGGSIGIAGPRGAGKSTLMASLCRGGLKHLGARPVYAILTSAPVKYDSREFILHLFSTLCYAVLKRSPSESAPSLEPVAVETPERSLRVFIRPLPPVAALAGIVLLVVGLALAAAHLAAESMPAPAAATPGAAPAPAARPTLAGLVLPSPGGFTTMGLGCLALGLIAWTFSVPFREHRLVRALMNRKPDDSPRGEETEEEAARRLGNPTLPKLALALLREIRFQRSYTSGWSGAFKLPVGLEGGASRAVTLADRQRSVPELVDEFRRFVQLLAERHAVIIGIDELDKIENDDHAQQFLNEIKSIFNLDHCYYLISVSENAINSFERRGLPFRDAFDSALDTILYVDYLDLEQGKRLIYRRVIGLDVPFVDLCFCLSGGLARDLIRVCREMFEAAATIQKSGLEDVAAQLVLTDVRAKLRALAASMKQTRCEPELGQFMAWIDAIDRATTSRPLFLATRGYIRRPQPTPTPAAGELPARTERRERLHELGWELYAYLYFAATILEFFNAALTQATLTAAESSGHLDTLARVRQTFALNAALAVARLDTVREAQGLALDPT